jgi:hypothetical protein
VVIVFIHKRGKNDVLLKILRAWGRYRLPFSRVKSKYHCISRCGNTMHDFRLSPRRRWNCLFTYGLSTATPLEGGIDSLAETSVINYHYSLHNNQEESNSQYGGSSQVFGNNPNKSKWYSYRNMRGLNAKNASWHPVKNLLTTCCPKIQRLKYAEIFFLCCFTLKSNLVFSSGGRNIGCERSKTGRWETDLDLGETRQEEWRGVHNE